MLDQLPTRQVPAIHRVDRSRNARLNRQHALIAILLAECLGAADATIFFTALYPILSSVLATKDTVVIGWYGSLVIATFMGGWGLGSIIFGVLADIFGPVRIMVGAIVLYSIATALCATSHTWVELALYRFIVGIGLGAQMSVGVALMGEFWPGRKRLQAMSALQLSFRFGRLLVGIFNLSLGALGWRIFFLLGSLPILLAPYFNKKVKEPEDYLHAAEKRRLLHTKNYRELTTKEKQFLRHPLLQTFSKEHLYHIVLYTLIAGTATIGYWVGISWIPAWINQLTHNSAVVPRATATMYSACGGITGCILSLHLISRLGWRRTLAGGLLSSLVVSLALFCLTKNYSPLINVWSFAIGLCAAIPFVVISVRIIEVFPHHILGTASGVVWSAGRLCAAVAALCTAPIMSFFRGSFALSAAAVTLVYIVGFIATYLVAES
jgi:MFS family permease